MIESKLLRRAAQQSPTALRDDIHVSFPIPQRAKGGLSLLFFYCPSTTSPKFGLQLMPPQSVAIASPTTGHVGAATPVNPAQFNQPHSVNEIIGTYEVPRDMTREQFVEGRERLYRYYDALMPQFSAGEDAVPPETKEIAKSFLELFLLITEQPLLPYYQAAGRDFFEWLQTISSK